MIKLKPFRVILLLKPELGNRGMASSSIKYLDTWGLL